MKRWPETESEAWEWLGRKLGTTIPPAVWRELCDERHVSTAIELASKEGFAELEHTARSYMRAASGRARLTSRRTRGGSKSLLTAAEVRRAEVVSVFLGKLASRDRAVTRFRKDVLNGRKLTQREARALLSSPLPYLLSVEELQAAEISLLDHQAEVNHTERPATDGKWVHHFELMARSAGRASTFELEVLRSLNDGMWLELPPRLWSLVRPFGEAQPVVRTASAFDELRKASEWLSLRFPWQRWEAVWFTLTDIPPFVPPIQPGIQTRTSAEDADFHRKLRRPPRKGRGAVESGSLAYRRLTLTLAIEPWVSATTLGKVFRTYQQALRGVRNRLTEAKSLELFEFVIVRREGYDRRGTWEDMMKEWNRDHKTWAYGDYRNFRKDYKRVRQAILLPKEPRFDRIPLWQVVG